MRLHKSTSLALFAVLEFARDPARQVSAAEVAQRYGVSPHHLAKVLAELVRLGIVASVRGAGGGYRFVGNARETTLLDIINAFEDVTPPALLHQGAGAPQPVEAALGELFAQIDRNARDTLAGISLLAMLRLSERHESQRRRRGGPAASPAPATAPEDRRDAVAGDAEAGRRLP